MLEIEGSTDEWRRRPSRHEAGHAIDNAHRLYDLLIDGCVVNEPFAAAVMARMPASRWSAWFIGCAGLNRQAVSWSTRRSSRYRLCHHAADALVRLIAQLFPKAVRALQRPDVYRQRIPPKNKCLGRSDQLSADALLSKFRTDE